MAKIGVSLKIDVTKIDKARLFKGAKGTYLDATVFIDVDDLDQYGNSGFIAQSVSEDERNSGVKGNILGNCKVFYKDQSQSTLAPQAPQPQAPKPQYAAPPAMDSFDDNIDSDIPF